VFYFAASNAIYIGGNEWLWLNDHPAFFMWFAFAALALISWLNIVGLKHARWLHNIGAYGMWLPVAIILVLALVNWNRFGSATEISAATMVPSFEIKDMLFWASLAFAFSGSETVSFMAGEVKEPRKVIPRALVISGSTVAACYILGTLAVMVILPPGETNSLSGLVQATTTAAARLGWLWLVPIVAFLITIGNIGAAGGFLAATSRIPFVAGIDRTLPPAFGKLHPKYGTPYVAIIAQTALGGLFVFLGQAGTSVKGAYDVLVSMGIITAFVPFLFVFLSLIAVQREPAREETMRVPGGSPVAIAVGVIGLLVTACAIGLAMLPAADEPNKPLAVAKIIGLTGILIGAGWAVFASSRRKALAAG
jgi:amino acid transporter